VLKWAEAILDIRMIDFGDRVRVLTSPETLAAGIAGREGETYGFTTPEYAEVNVIGGFLDGQALYLSLDPSDMNVWIRPDLVELVHRNPGVEVMLDGMRLVRQPDGSWLQEPITDGSHAESADGDIVERLVHAFKSRRASGT
jgi:hypothetical protein